MAWELGEGISYVKALIPVARALAAQGHRPVFALQNLVEPRAVLGTEFAALQAPLWHPRRWRGDQPFRAASFADVLAIKGYAAIEDLAALVRGRQDLLDLVQPRLVVAAYAPTLCLTAYGTVPVVTLGKSWFGTPPVTEPDFPVLVPGRQPLVAAGTLLEVVQEVQRQRQRPLPPTLPAALAGEQRLLLLLPEVDGYRSWRREPHLGPPDPLPEPSPPPPDRSFFAYLSADYSRCEEVLGVLARHGWQGTAFLRNATEPLRERLRQAGLILLDRPAGNAEMFQAAVLVHHGGVGLSQVGLAAGRPQLLFPMHLEQEINGRTLHQLGVAHHLQGKFPAADVVGAIQEVHGQPRFVAQVTEWGRELQARAYPPTLSAILAGCACYL